MYNTFKFTAEESAFIVEADGRRLRVSFEETFLPYKKAMDWCKEHGGGDETVDNLRLLAKYRWKINAELAAIYKEEIHICLWTNETCYHDDSCAFVVDECNGSVRCERANTICGAHAVYSLMD